MINPLAPLDLLPQLIGDSRLTPLSDQLSIFTPATAALCCICGTILSVFSLACVASSSISGPLISPSFSRSPILSMKAHDSLETRVNGFRERLVLFGHLLLHGLIHDLATSHYASHVGNTAYGLKAARLFLCVARLLPVFEVVGKRRRHHHHRAEAIAHRGVPGLRIGKEFTKLLVDVLRSRSQNLRTRERLLGRRPRA